jgi:hypothetical protein
MRACVKIVTLLVWLVVVPTAAFAQAVIAGTVKDPSGGVLPGVVVEATSPALIEKVRAAVTDGTGQYRIEDLRPGAYIVTFTLQGFSTFRREGVELSGSFTATINADLKVGALAETITVTGETPVVDVQSARREVTLNSDVIKSIPTVRSYNALVIVVPGVVTNLNDTVTGTATTQFPIHGGRNNEGRMTIDGLNIGNPVGGNHRLCESGCWNDNEPRQECQGLHARAHPSPHNRSGSPGSVQSVGGRRSSLRPISYGFFASSAAYSCVL